MPDVNLKRTFIMEKRKKPSRKNYSREGMMMAAKNMMMSKKAMIM